MFKNYFKIAMRNMMLNKGFTFINIFGLAMGMAVCILIMVWVQDELSVNTFHEKYDNLYRIRTWQQYGEKRALGSGTPPALGPALQSEYPEIIKTARIQNGQGERLISYKDKQFKERIQLADASLFDIFSFPLTKGTIESFENDPHVMIMSEEIAKKYFDEEDPIGKTVSIDHRFDFRIVGIMKSIPHNSTIQFKCWVPLIFADELYERQNFTNTWYNCSFNTYAEIVNDISIEAFNKKIKDRIKNSDPNTNLEPMIYPFKDIYLKMWGSEEQVRLFSLIALGVLLIACINYINLTTAKSIRRAQEVGLRKVVGAHQKQLVRQFFGEVLLITLLSMFLAILLAELLLPTFCWLTQKPLEINFLNNTTLTLGILGITLLTGIISGLYPAFFLSNFKPASVLKGEIDKGTKGSTLRKSLTVFQFALSTFLIFGSIVIYKQINFMQNKQLGYEKEQLVYIPLESNLKSTYEAFKQELLNYPQISNVSVTSHSTTGVWWNGQGWNWEGRDPNINPLVTYFRSDGEFIETFRIEMAEGIFFNSGFTGSDKNIVINEHFADMMGLDTPVGRSLSQGDNVYNIIGVIKNFHFKPTYCKMDPLIIFNNEDIRGLNYIFIRIHPENVSETISFIKKTAEGINPGFPFEYHFLDDDFAQMYNNFQRFISIIQSFAILAIAISCLGLLGLAAFMAGRRTKEIGVRKVLGANISNILVLLSKEFTKWVLIGNAIGLPVAYYIMYYWLQDYPYRTTMGITIFLITLLSSLIIAIITVSIQSIKTALTNPVEALRYE